MYIHFLSGLLEEIVKHSTNIKLLIMKILAISKIIKNTSYKKGFWVPTVEQGPPFRFLSSLPVWKQNGNQN